ncbi:MAG: MaoC family dehydratase [Microscillaceae bacterium]
MLIQVKQTFCHVFSFSQAEVEQFAQISGDHNPVHLDEAYAAQTPFKRRIIHGFLTGSVFSKVFGTLFPGEGTIYLRQDMEFARPMFVDTPYEALFEVISIDREKHRAVVRTTIQDQKTRKETIRGEAVIMHPQLI